MNPLALRSYYVRYAGIAGLAALGILTRTASVSGPVHVSQAAASSTPVAADSPVATNIFLADLVSHGLTPTPLTKVTKPQLSIPGVLIALGNDNLQTFEYATESGASGDAQKFKKFYANRLRRGTWWSFMHLYTRRKSSCILYGR
jgi:hypothetical protein